MTDHAFCVHGHFYQPPREDPLTGEIPVEPGSAPYPNWNERIHDHCYRPNAELGNFEQISFNIGPTLVSWLAEHHPETLRLIIEQENRNYSHYGVGNGMAQAYNHTILPLACREDKVTQVRWGIADFVCRFGHPPAGMWLPETAVDEETLLVLAENGILFTILAPWQVEEADIDIRQPYRVMLPGGKEITVFLYDQDLSTRVSFDPGATIDGDGFIRYGLLQKYTHDEFRNGKPQFLMVASDGELYGHHQPYRDKFLAYLLDGALKKYPISTNYPGRWLREHPAREIIRVRNNTSWSCQHGVTRWMDACGCTPHGEWKNQLRQAFLKIADLVDGIYLGYISEFLDSPWELRHQYHHVLCGMKTVGELLDGDFGIQVSEREQKIIHLLLSAQYERQRMFTSCGWFFDDFDRIEPKNNVAYAAQAIWLTYRASGEDYSSKAIEALSAVRSWRTGVRGDVVFKNYLERAQRQQLQPTTWIPG